MKYTFTQVYTGEWNPVRKPVLWCCCDCGLAHRYEFRTRKGKLEYRCFRNGPMTRASRASKKLRFTRRPK